jgi:hypothetical protein
VLIAAHVVSCLMSVPFSVMEKMGALIALFIKFVR